MNKQELKRLTTSIKVAYPSFTAFDDMQTQAIAVEMWLRMLSDIDYSVAMLALEKHVATNKYPPTIADIRGYSLKVSSDNMIPTSSEAWGQVLTAIRNHGMYDGIGALESMHPLVAGVVKRFGWKEICTSENIDVIRGQFAKQYESQASGAREYEQLAGPTKANIDNYQAVNGIVNTLANKFGAENNKIKLIDNTE